MCVGVRCVQFLNLAITTKLENLQGGNEDVLRECQVSAPFNSITTKIATKGRVNLKSFVKYFQGQKNFQPKFPGRFDNCFHTYPGFIFSNFYSINQLARKE